MGGDGRVGSPFWWSTRGCCGCLLQRLLWHQAQAAEHARCLPVPLGSDTVARSCWSVYLGSMFSLACTSTVSVNFAEAVSRHSLMASSAGSADSLEGTLARCAAKRRDTLRLLTASTALLLLGMPLLLAAARACGGGEERAGAGGRTGRRQE